MIELTSEQIAAELAPSGQPWGWGVRTVGSDRRSLSDKANGFQWPSEPGSVVVAPDWAPTAKCGQGLHINPFGMGDWSLVSRHEGAIWQLVKYDPALIVELDGGERGGKIKAPWVILHRDCPARELPGLMAELDQRRTEHVQAMLQQQAEAPTTGYAAHSSTTGARAHSSTTGDDAHSSTTGYAAHSSTTGASAIAVSIGVNVRAKASVGGAIMLSELAWNAREARYDLLNVFASKVGENGVEPDVWYELKDGKPVAVAP